MEDLATWAELHGTDKRDHGYIPFYDSLFSPMRHESVTLLEIGVGGFSDPEDPSAGGESLRLWRDFFPAGTIVGLDILDKSGVAGERVHVVQGSQVDPQCLERLARQYGPFDIVIDDGSHVPAHVRFTFDALLPHLKPDGIYVIEDTQTSYWPQWGGAFRLNARRTSMAMVKQRLDHLNHAEFKRPGFVPSAADRRIVEIRARHNIVAFVCGSNDRPSRLNRSHPVPTRSWLREELAPVAVQRLRHPVVLSALDKSGARGGARWVRRRLFGWVS